MSSPPVNYARRNITPAIARLAYSFDCPVEWQQLEVPAETPDFSDPGAFMPLGVFISPFGAILFSVAGRPAFEDGSVYDWTKFLLEHHKLTITQLVPGELSGIKAVRAMATQASDAGPMQMNVAMFEDGQSIIHVTAMAPQQLYGSMAETFEHMLNSFALANPQGPTAPLIPGMAVEKKAAPSAKASSAAPKKDDVKKRAKETTKKPTPPGDPTDITTLAIADDADTLTNPEQKLNAYFRDNGIGLLPRVMSMHEEEKYAVMGCGAVVAGVAVPFGWQVFDDGKRTLVFTPDNKVQVNLSLLQVADGTLDQRMDRIIAETTAEQPQVQSQKTEGAGIPMLVFGGLNIEGEILDQVFMFVERQNGLYLQIRVTAAAQDMHRALDLAGAMAERIEPAM